MKKYYYDDKMRIDVLEKYKTIWRGYFITSSEEKTFITKDHFLEINELCANKFDVGFYLTVDKNYLYMSICPDSEYYYHQFEKDILKIAKDIQKCCNVKICKGSFQAWECRPDANMFNYTIYIEKEKLKLKKSEINIHKYEEKKIMKIKNLNLNSSS
jgi:hypothetical protein